MGRLYSWFIGYAPREARQIAVSAVTVSESGRTSPGAYLGKEAMRFFYIYIEEQGLEFAR
jgi:hypothetical protein